MFFQSLSCDTPQSNLHYTSLIDIPSNLIEGNMTLVDLWLWCVRVHEPWPLGKDPDSSCPGADGATSGRIDLTGFIQYITACTFSRLTHHSSWSCLSSAAASPLRTSPQPSLEHRRPATVPGKPRGQEVRLAKRIASSTGRSRSRFPQR